VLSPVHSPVRALSLVLLAGLGVSAASPVSASGRRPVNGPRRELVRTSNHVRMPLQRAMGSSTHRPRQHAVGSGVGRHKTHPIDASSFGKLSLGDVQRLAGRSRWFADGSEEPTLQTIVLPESLGKPTRRLVDSLVRKSFGGKARNRATVNWFKSSLAEYARNLEGWSISPDGVAAGVAFLKGRKAPAAETGALRITLRSGRVVTAIMTSSNWGRIDAEAYNKAQRGLLASQKVSTLDPITKVQFFHTHPVPGALSPGDADFARAMKAIYREIDPNIPVEMHSISVIQGSAVLNRIKLD
jgi:hypothetical protein